MGAREAGAKLQPLATGGGADRCAAAECNQESSLPTRGAANLCAGELRKRGELWQVEFALRAVLLA